MGTEKEDKAKAKAGEEKEAGEENQCEGAPAQLIPKLSWGASTKGNLTKALNTNRHSNPPNQWEGPRRHQQHWQSLGADKALLQAIATGVRAPLNSVPKPNKPRQLTSWEQDSMTTTIGEYLAEGAIKELTTAEMERTHFWTAIFPRPKKDSNKVRIITDMRDLNTCNQVPKHKADTWNTVLTTLGDRKNQWGLTIDLKGWFHHLRMHQKTQRWMRFQHKGTGYQIVGMPFGWALSPYWANKMTKPIRAWLNNKQWPHTWWVDDILILGETQAQTEHRAAELINLFTALGVTVNQEKTMPQAAQRFTYVGHHINLQTNRITGIPTKVHHSITMTKHQMKSTRTTPIHLAALAGNLIDTAKSNIGLQGLPAQLMKAAATAVHNNMTSLGHWDKSKCWRMSTDKNRIPNLTNLLQECLREQQTPTPRVFRGLHPQKWTLQTDASDRGWGAALLHNGREHQTCAQTWTAEQQKKHITHREALASALAVHHMIDKIPRGTKLTLQTDASSTAWAWKKGSKNKAMNDIVTPAVKQLHLRDIHTEAMHIPGQTNKRADWLSRNPDPKNYQLVDTVYHKMCRIYRINPQVDLFASKNNKKCQQYCSWRLDKDSLGNAFQVTWHNKTHWLNPPGNSSPRSSKSAKQTEPEHWSVSPCGRQPLGGETYWE